MKVYFTASHTKVTVRILCRDYIHAGEFKARHEQAGLTCGLTHKITSDFEYSEMECGIANALIAPYSDLQRH